MRPVLASMLSFLRAPPRTVHVVGDVYLDMIAKIHHLPVWDSDTTIHTPIQTLAGGSALNTAAQLTALLRSGRKPNAATRVRRCVLHSRLGEDINGKLVATHIQEAGIALSATRGGVQGVCICLSGEHDRSFVSYKGSVSELSVDDLNHDLLFSPSATHVHFAAYFDCAGLRGAVPELLHRAKECGATTSLVPQADSSGEWSSLLATLRSGKLDVLICNQGEAAAIAGIHYAGQRPTWDETDKVAQKILQLGVPLVVLTLGADGAVAMSSDQW